MTSHEEDDSQRKDDENVEIVPSFVTQVKQHPQPAAHNPQQSSRPAAASKGMPKSAITNAGSSRTPSRNPSINQGGAKGKGANKFAPAAAAGGKGKVKFFPNQQQQQQQQQQGNKAIKSGGSGGGIFSCFACLFPPRGVGRRNSTAGSNQVIAPNIVSQDLLPPLAPEDEGKKCLVLDLDETLVHSAFKPVPGAAFKIPIEIDSTVHNVFVLKRPFVDQFIEELAPYYEMAIFTASLAKYADPLLDLLDPKHLIKHRLFREACIHHKGNYVKDLSLLGRPIEGTIIIDNSPSCYAFHPENAIPCISWFSDTSDRELLEFIPVLKEMARVKDVREALEHLDESLSKSNSNSPARAGHAGVGRESSTDTG